MRARLRSDEPFELDTFWWNPTSDGQLPATDRKARAHGTLVYTPDRGLELTTFDLDLGVDALQEPSSVPILCGETLQHKPCVLFNAVPVSTEGTLFGGHQRIVFRAHQFVLGEHFSTVDGVRSKRFKVRLRGLGEWLMASHRLNDDQAVAGMSREGKPEGLSLVLEGCQLHLGFDWRERGGRVVEEHATASFEFGEELELQSFFSDWLVPLQDLLVLANREQSILESLLAERYDERRWEQIPPAIRRGTRPEAFNRWHVEVVRTPNVPLATPRDSAFNHILLPAAAIAQDIEGTLRRWYALRWELREAGGFFFTRLNQDTPPLDTHLLGCMSFAETFHRTRHGATPVDKREHYRVRRLMLDCLGEHPQRALYEHALANANRQPNRERIEELFDRAREVGVRIDLQESTLPAELVATRNYLTHWSTRSNRVLSREDLFDAVRRLVLVLQVNLLLDIGLEDSTVEACVEQSYETSVWRDASA